VKTLKLIIFLFFLLVYKITDAQETIIKVLDFQSGQPVPYANISFETPEGKIESSIITDKEGVATNNIKKRSVIAISSIGYITKTDTIDPAQSRIIFLQPVVYNVDEIVITGQIKAVKADKSIYKIDVINNRQILDKNANNLSELLSGELNVRTMHDASLGTNLNIQGLSGEHVKILIDGVPLIGRQNGILDLNQILLSNVDHIEIIEGPMSVTYGSNALAGVINVITKEPNQGRYQGKVYTYYESAGIYNFDGSLAYHSKAHTLTASAGRNFFEGFSAVDTSRSKQWKPKEQYYGNMDYFLRSNSFKLRTGLNFFKEELRNPGDPFRNQRTYMAIDEYHYITRWEAKVNYSKTFKNSGKIELITADSYYNKTKKTTTKDMSTLNENLSTDPLAQDTSVFSNIMSRLVYSNKPEGTINYQGGFDGNIETGKGKRLNGKKQIGDYAGFITAVFFPRRKLNTQTGLRVAYNTKFNAPVVYSLNLRYAPVDRVLLRASYGKGVRMPSLKELYLDFVDINHNITGNDQLNSESSDNFNVSGLYTLQIKKHIFTLDATLFYNNFKNKISLLRINNSNAYTYYNVNAGNYITRGAEIQLQYQFHPRFSLNAGMNFLGRSKIGDLKNLYNSTDYTINFNYRSLRYLFMLSAFYKYTDDWYDANVQYTNKNEIGTISPSYMKRYHTLDISLSRPFFRNSLEVAIGLKNLFNNKNIFSYGSSGDNPHSGADTGNTPVGWGRTVFVRLSYNFVKY
jgi:outer membrane receptor for ferrienterochelin and colicins